MRRDVETSVQLFGEAYVKCAGNVVPLSPMQLSLVAIVYGHGRRGLSRPKAIHLLWDACSEAAGRHRVRQLLLDIRQRVGQQIVWAHRDRLGPLSSVESDVEKFNVALKAGPLVEAAELVSLGFIDPSATLPKRLEDWRVGQERSLLRALVTTASSRWALAHARGDWGAANDAAEALHIVDSRDALAVARVIESRGRLGRTGQAEAAYASYRAALPKGAECPRCVETALDRVRRSASTAGGSGARSAENVIPFVGRRQALLEAERFLREGDTDFVDVLLIAGESGIGKSRLLDEIQIEGVLRGFRCLRAQSVELEQAIPLNPLLDALCQVEDLEQHLESVGEPWGSVVAGLLPPGTLSRPPSEPPPIESTSLSRRLLDSFSLVLEEVASETPTLLLLDDFHWADATTVTTLQFLRRRWRRGALRVCATLRPELVTATSPVGAYVAGHLSSGAPHIELGALSANEALELVRAIAGESVDVGHARRLCAVAGEHPLYLTELTRELITGRLALPEGPSGEIVIPTSLGNMLDTRIEAMAEHTLRVAGILAVAGKALGSATIADLTGLELPETATAIEALVRTRFVRVEGDRVCIAHDLFRSAVYRHLSAPLRALHHGAIARTLLAGSPEDAAEELAIHFARAGEHAEAARFGWIAARRAMEAGAVAEAITLFGIVKEAEPDLARRADATAEHARALHLSRDITGANPQLLAAANQLRRHGQAKRARRLEILRVGGLAEVNAGSIDELLSGLRLIKAEAREAGDWEGVALALDAELQLQHRAGDVAAIRKLFSEFREVATKELAEARLLARAGLALGVFFEDPDEALLSAQEAVSLAKPGGAYRLRVLNRLLVVLQARGLLMMADVSPHVEEARALAERSGDPLTHFSVESNIAVAYLDAGEIERAEALLERANNVAGRGEMHINRFIQANNQAELFMAKRDYPAAADFFSRAASFLGPTTPRYMQDLVNAGLGHCALETGDLSEARRREALLTPFPASWYFDPTTILAFKARFLERRGRPRDAIALLTEGATDLEGRLTLAWLKVVLLKLELVRKYRVGGGVELARRAGSCARRLGLVVRAGQFEELEPKLRPAGTLCDQ